MFPRGGRSPPRQDPSAPLRDIVPSATYGRKERITPLTTPTVTVLAAWLHERAGQPDDPVFPTRQGQRLSRDAIEHRLNTHTTTAATRDCPMLSTKNVTCHVLRHTAAMRLLEAGIDTTVIALWLGHEQTDTTAIYLHADLSIKERALARTTPTRNHTRPLPATRQTPRLPRSPLNHPGYAAPATAPTPPTRTNTTTSA